MAKFSQKTFAQKLESWFQTAQRELPWREPNNARDPYRVLVSEVMLQQTTVAAVIPYYTRFLERFSTIESLAAVEVKEVLPLWAGLGYYSRARNLHAAACAVMEKYGGKFPETLDEVLALPGIGRYTAGAVLSIAFNKPIPIVDANVARVLARVLCLEGDLKNNANQKRLWEEATRLVEASTSPSQFNPAMMELGALICVPKNPRCEVCPVAKHCCAFKTNRQNELPHATAKRETIEMHDVCAFIMQGNKVLLRRRSDKPGEKNWWRGMWELPRTTCRAGESTQAALQRFFTEELQLQIEVGEKVKTVAHGVTHHKITLDCYGAQIVGAHSSAPHADVQFFAWNDIESLALPSTMRRLLHWIKIHSIKNKQMRLL